MANSTVSGNNAAGGAGIYFTQVPGQPFTTVRSLHLVNSTFFGNTATQVGGGLYLDAGDANLHNCTITANRTNSPQGSAGISVAAGSQTLIMGNSIVAGNTVGNNANVDIALAMGSGPSVRSGGYNLVGKGNLVANFSSVGDVTAVTDPGLEALADNGGSTLTCKPLPGSPAIDAGETTLDRDQIGNPRPRGYADDIGALEIETAPLDPQLVVTTDADTAEAGDGLVSLHEAITSANSYASNSPASSSVITFDPVFFATRKTIFLLSELPAISANVAIAGPAAAVSLHANGGVQYGFQFSSGNIRLMRFCVLAANTAAISNEANLTVDRCTFSSNRVNAIVNSGTGRLTLVNSTLALNGAALVNQGAAQISIYNCTIAGNTAAGISNTGASVRLHDSIVAGNAPNLDGSLSTDESNFFGTLQDAGLKTLNGEALLQDNGGPTDTVALLLGSPAIDSGSNNMAIDQRGMARPSGAASDMGAFEFQYQESFVVTTLADENDGTSDPRLGSGTSLREAISAAHNNGPGRDDITFSLSLFNIRQTLTAGTALPTITGDVTISAPPAGLILNAPAGSCQLRIVAGTVVLSGLTLACGGTSSGVANDGGVVILQNSTITGAQDYALRNQGEGALTLRNSTIANCPNGTAVASSATLSIRNCTIVDNRNGLTIDGGSASLTNSIVANNFADDITGALTVDAYNRKFVEAQADLDPAGLKDNGGQSDTIALLPGSQAIDAGDDAHIDRYSGRV